MLKYAIVGFGGLGKLHYKNCMELEKKRDDIKLVALCDVEEERFHTNVSTNLDVDSSGLNIDGKALYTDIDVMLEKEDLDFVITAVPTYLHKEIAVKALRKGLHVFSEKPMAINMKEAKEMLEIANQNNRKLMIGQCLRYWPEYVKLNEMVQSGIYGKLIRAEFFRYSSTPVWSWQNWFLDVNKSGGAALDNHVHDVDFIHWTFGKPLSVSSRATHYKSGYDSIFTLYEYPDFVITAASDWGLPATYPFRPDFLAHFEKAVVTSNDKGFMIYPEEGEVFFPELPKNDPYASEIVDFIESIQTGKVSSVNPAESVIGSLEIALAEMKSAADGQSVSL